MSKIRYYISSHGLGHASRSCQIINTLRRRHPQVAVEVVSAAHPWFFGSFLDPSVPVRPLVLDVGVLQRDSLLMCERETLQAYRDFLPERDRIVTDETASLRGQAVTLVVADIPPAPFAVARAAGVPAVGIANFTWDWVYEGLAEKFPGYEDVLASVRADYGCADRLLRLPFYGEFPLIRRIEDLPLVARRAGRDRAEARRLLGLPAEAKIGLISFGGFGLMDFTFDDLERLSDWIFLTETGLEGRAPNLRRVAPGILPYPDLVRAADAVITKPGYGIVSEAIVNETAVLYTSRGDFREQPLLVSALQRFARALEIGNDDLRRGNWGEALEKLLALPQPVERIDLDGDVVAADRLAELA
jgi:hypothetical protein